MPKPRMPDHLLERGKAFYFWRRVPTDLVGTFTSTKSNKPLQAIRVSLGTKLTRRAAEAMARRMSVDWDKRFAAARQKPKRRPAPDLRSAADIAHHRYTEKELATANAIARVDL